MNRNARSYLKVIWKLPKRRKQKQSIAKYGICREDKYSAQYVGRLKAWGNACPEKILMCWVGEISRTVQVFESCQRSRIRQITTKSDAKTHLHLEKTSRTANRGTDKIANHKCVWTLNFWIGEGGWQKLNAPFLRGWPEFGTIRPGVARIWRPSFGRLSFSGQILIFWGQISIEYLTPNIDIWT